MLQNEKAKLEEEFRKTSSASPTGFAKPSLVDLPQDPNTVTLDKAVLDALDRVHINREVMVALANEIGRASSMERI